MRPSWIRLDIGDGARLGQAQRLAEQGEARTVVTEQAVLGAGIDEAGLVLCQGIDGEVGEAAILVEQSEAEMLGGRRDGR
nr:hypothetical protein [uncultured Lichenicoccus sp.]